MSDDADDLLRKSQRLARELLEAMQRPAGDAEQAERAASEAQKARTDAAALEDYYQRTGQAEPDRTPRARTTQEMRFAASLVPCPGCGSRQPAKYELTRGGSMSTLTGPCPQCGTRRAHAWATEGDPLKGAAAVYELGDSRPSQLISVGQFMAEYDRVLPFLREDPEALAPVDWKATVSQLHHALTCVLELRKFVPANMKVIPDTRLDEATRGDRVARRARYTAAWLDAEVARIRELLARYAADAPRIWALDSEANPPPVQHGAIDRNSLRAHEAWLRRGRTGEGRLDVAGFNAKGLRLGGALFSEALLARVTFDQANLGAARFGRSELTEVSMDRAAATSIDLKGAKLTRGTWKQTDLRLATFDGAVIEETAFPHCDFDRSTWSGARITAASFEHARFGNARLDGAVFAGCVFRDAWFAPTTDRPYPTTAGAKFEDCDLRRTLWTGRDLSGATFLRCKLGGARGEPASLEGAVFLETDLSPDGDGSDRVSDVASVLARLRGG
ncbi:pentapeptide repeat-containing protein [Pyxidicoccus xibeiensis]|uniref:pentapeptide repeat-containing protein n=1 Tax=Pyxidicoccus xibeiensis TaxID=2906759 RepID=UPI0020A73801|nr:pentapeptide repeat-containing protein [Pyxidicoccus xibeiensis]MCP3138322.1 pentapeptide repeat-containing protein [Pyxidicoccus xibeiensis]